MYVCVCVCVCGSAFMCARAPILDSPHLGKLHPRALKSRDLLKLLRRLVVLAVQRLDHDAQVSEHVALGVARRNSASERSVTVGGE